MILRLPLLLGLVLAWPALADWGQKNLALPPPAPVVDEFGLLDPAERAKLDESLRQIKSRSGVEITFFAPASLRGREIEDFSIATAEEWKLGRKKEDKGLLIIVAPKERRMRIEVGYGMEGEITDAFSRQVLDNVMAPFFRQGRYGDGVMAGLLAIQQKIPLGLDSAPQPPLVGSGGGVFSKIIFWFFIVLFVFLFLNHPLLVLSFLFSGRGGGGSWGRRGGGSSWGGGGGGFGGGGASSRW